MKNASGQFPWIRIILPGCLLVVLLGLLWPRHRADDGTAADASGATNAGGASAAKSARATRHGASSQPGLTAEQTVAAKVSQFARKRRAVAHGMAEKLGIKVTPQMEHFFDLAENGNFDDMKTLFDALTVKRDQASYPVELLSPLRETFGVAQIAHDWPAQKLLDYGEAILGSLRPGMVYVGGTDPGRFIPTLLNETGSGDPHIILTQNALADSTYLDYVRYLYGDQASALSAEDSQKGFQTYMEDAQKRLAHDQQFPDEPKQVLPGEDLQIKEDGRFQVSGQVAVMLINEKLLQAFMDKNPDLSFALEESFPLKSTYANAAPLGPIMELRVGDAQQEFTPDAAAQSVNYWQTTADRMLADIGDGTATDYVLKTYAKMAATQAALFADHHLPAQAEQAYQIATQMYPGSPDAAQTYADFLVGQNRFADAVKVAQNAVKAAPGNQQLLALLQQLRQRGN